MRQSRAAEMQARKEKARASGVCITCLKNAVPPSRHTCAACNLTAKTRMLRVYERRRERRRVVAIARNYEAAGDTAMAGFAYVEASAQYERALTESRTLSALHTTEDEVRLCDKIAESMFFGPRPDLATPWYERELELCMATKSLRGKVTSAMRKLPLQRWIESRTKESLQCSLRARASAIADGNSSAMQATNISIASWLIILGQYSKAERYLVRAYQENALPETMTVRAYRPIQRAIILATQGHAPLAFAEFDRAVEEAKQLPDGYYTTIVWDDYANWATVLGRLNIARACRERALLVARERRIAWRIPYLTLRLADTLVTYGKYSYARDLVRDALTYDTNVPTINVLLSTVGLKVAYILNDDMLLQRTMDDRVLDLALQSGEPARIAPIVAAFAKVQVAHGKLRRAKTLIDRGIEAITQADHTGDLLALAARYASPAHAAHARRLLVERMAIPHHRVSQAFFSLWEAYDALRRRASGEAQERARDAARLFGQLGWKYQQTEALLLGDTSRERVHKVKDHTHSNNSSAVLSDLNPTLTVREQQVAELVLRGLTNRAIAQTLSISEHTVETHMTSILNRLGLRSRWQLADLSE